MQSLRDPVLTRQNYRGRMHDLLAIEELAQFHHLGEFNVVVTMKLVDKYYLTGASSNSSSAKYVRPGELFGKVILGK